MDLTTDGTTLYIARASGRHVTVNERKTQDAPAALMGERIAVSPDGQIGVVARSADNQGFACLLGQPWMALGPTAQNQGIVWKGGRFVCGRIGPRVDNVLIEQSIDGTVLRSTYASTSQGILYHDEYLGWVIASNDRVTLVGSYRLIKAVRRGVWYCGQATNPDRLVIVKSDGSVTFKAGDQPETPMFTVIGDELCCVVRGGEVKRFKPPYPTTDVVTPPPPVVVPVPPPIVPVEPVMPSLSAAEKSTITRFVAKFPLPQGEVGSAHEERCRVWTEMLAEQLDHDHGDEDTHYGAKKASEGRPKSKDAFARTEPGNGLSAFDVMIGAGTGKPTLATNPAYHDIKGQVFVPVQAKNHLATPPPVEPPPVEPPPVVVPPVTPPPVPPVCEFAPCNHAEVNARLDKIEAAQVAILAALMKDRPVELAAGFLGTLRGTVKGPQ